MNHGIICLYYYPQNVCNFTWRYFKLSWNTTAVSQSYCRNFSWSGISHETLRKIFIFHFYLGCLDKLADQAPNPGTICCPSCKTETPLYPWTVGCVRNLPKNFGVLEVLESREAGQTEAIQQEKEKNFCPEHSEALKVYCYTDNCFICIYCQVLIFVCWLNEMLIALSCHCTISDNNPNLFSFQGQL